MEPIENPQVLINELLLKKWKKFEGKYIMWENKDKDVYNFHKFMLIEDVINYKGNITLFYRDFDINEKLGRRSRIRVESLAFNTLKFTALNGEGLKKMNLLVNLEEEK